jgi:uncharacterized membrane protein YjdF
LAGGDEAAALKCLLVLVPAVAARLTPVPTGFDLVFTLALACEAIVSGLTGYGWIEWPDEASHLVIPLLSAPVVYHLLVRLSATSPPDAAAGAQAHVGAGIVTSAGVLALGALWELVEWGADRGLGTDYSQGYEDTLSDLRADALAAALGGVLVAAWLRRQRKRAERSAASPQLNYQEAA